MSFVTALTARVASPARPGVTGPVRGRVTSRVQVNRETTIQQHLRARQAVSTTAGTAGGHGEMAKIQWQMNPATPQGPATETEPPQVSSLSVA